MNLLAQLDHLYQESKKNQWLCYFVSVIVIHGRVVVDHL